MYYKFLNEKVEEEATKDITLYALMRKAIGEYDDDIEPLHNPTWVRNAKLREASILVIEKERLAKFKNEFYK